MVIFGGLEFVAAGYVLHELGKDEDKARQTAENRRGRRHNSHSHHRRDSDSRPRPPRPSQQSLAPPMRPPPRPNSAPPQQQILPPKGRPPPGPAGPWMNGPPQHQHQQRPPQFPPHGPPAHTQSWPVQAQPPIHQPQLQRPNTQPPPQLGPNSPMFRPSDFPSNPNNRSPFPQQHPQYNQSPPPPQPQYQNHQPQPPPPGPVPTPGQLPHRPTMHFDTKTGKWQSNMLPREEAQGQGQRSGSAPPAPNALGGPARTGSNNFAAPPSRLREGSRAYSSGEYSGESSSEDSEGEGDLAYGSLPGRRRRRRRSSGGGGWRADGAGPDVAKVHSWERQRPVPGPVELRAEEDWYARGREERVGYRGGSGGAGVGGGMGGGVDGRGRAGTMPVELDSRMRYELP